MVAAISKLTHVTVPSPYDRRTSAGWVSMVARVVVPGGISQHKAGVSTSSSMAWSRCGNSVAFACMRPWGMTRWCKVMPRRVASVGAGIRHSRWVPDATAAQMISTCAADSAMRGRMMMSAVLIAALSS